MFFSDVLATSRTYNQTSEGTYGQFISGQKDDSAFSLNVPAYLIQLSSSSDATSGYRTNIGVVNLSPVEIPVDIELFNASGLGLGHIYLNIAPWGYLQQGRVFAGVGAEGTEDGFAVVRTSAQDGRFLAYASVVDNQTNDPTYIPGN